MTKVDEKSKGLYYNVNKRKKAGTSRPKNHPKAPSAQDWKDAAKTAKEDNQMGMDPKHREIAGLGRKMIDMASKMTGTDDNTLMMANALSRLGDTLTNFGANFGPKSMDDVVRITGMDKAVISALVKKAKADTGSSDNQAAEGNEFAKKVADLKAKGAPKGTKFKTSDGQEHVLEGLADMADIAERDHEVQMARAELYKIAKYSIKLHEMMKNISEAQGLEGWMQSKITKAADYLGSVYHTLDYDQSPIARESHEFTMSDEDVNAYKDTLAEKMSKKKLNPLTDTQTN